jgi:hypothetical protein
MPTTEEQHLVETEDIILAVLSVNLIGEGTLGKPDTGKF